MRHFRFSLIALTLAAAGIVAGCLASESHVRNDPGVLGASVTGLSVTDAANPDIRVTDLRAMADEQREVAAHREWVIERGPGSSGMFDLSGIALSTAAGMTADEIRAAADDARNKAEELDRLAADIESRAHGQVRTSRL